MSLNFDPPFELERPGTIGAPILFNSPHSGRVYPPEFVASSSLGKLRLRRSEDAFVDTLLGEVIGLGMPLLKAHFPRAYIDVNREPYELDPSMFAGDLPAEANTGSLRVAGGLGTIPRIVAEAAEIYDAPLPVSEAHGRINALYLPYHDCLAKTLGELQAGAGFALLLDCHSMPSGKFGSRPSRADFVLGDRFGTSCLPEIIDAVERCLVGQGFSVARNRPFAGGYITQAYGRPAEGLHALQVEINRGLYMNEVTIAPARGFAQVKRALTFLAAEMRDVVLSYQNDLLDAAE